MGKSIAWMLRRDGKAIQVPVHAYGDEEDPEYILMNAEWLYNNTRDEKTKQDIVNLIALYAVNNDCVDVSTFEEYLEEDGDYLVINLSFIESISDKLEETMEYYIDNAPNGNIDENTLNKIVMDDLNQEFCRVRAGGVYDSDGSLGDLYFRTSSSGFNWFDVIWDFVYKLYKQNKVSTVTIVRDKESTGEDKVYYNRMPVEEFITLSGHPYIESVDRRN
ncbi:MAG: hypothetical protein J6T10_28910 [Methanobrevibacter sp.]|nr:hypothetical protein [Methanobrevibacter sp.]